MVESFGDCPPLSRFTVRDIHRAVAVGIVKSVKKKPLDGATTTTTNTTTPVVVDATAV